MNLIRQLWRVQLLTLRLLRDHPVELLAVVFRGFDDRIARAQRRERLRRLVEADLERHEPSS